MINVPYAFSGIVEWQSYEEIEDRIKQFPEYEVIGKDASGNYDMYMIRLGNPEKPPILVTASVHGIEWQSTSYSMATFEMLRDGTYPDKELMNTLLNDFQLIYLPVLNPWGLDNNDDPKASTNLTYYRNSNYVDINRDFVNRTQEETRNVIRIMERFQPFSHMDLHLFQPKGSIGLEGYDLIVGTETQNNYPYRDLIADSLENYTGIPVSRWDIQPERFHMVRGYTSFSNNPFTDRTLSFLSEIERPDNHNSQVVSDEQIFEWGNAFLYIFLKTSLQFYNSMNENNFIKQIDTPTKKIEVERNSKGLAVKIIETFKADDRIIESTINRNSDDDVSYIDRKLM